LGFNRAKARVGVSCSLASGFEVLAEFLGAFPHGPGQNPEQRNSDCQHDDRKIDVFKTRCRRFDIHMEQPGERLHGGRMAILLGLVSL